MFLIVLCKFSPCTFLRARGGRRCLHHGWQVEDSWAQPHELHHYYCILLHTMHGKGNCPIYPSGQTPHAYHEPLLNRYMTFMYLQIKVYKCNQGWGQPFLSYPSLVSHPEFMYVHCEKKRVSLTKLWSPHLQPSSHLHLVIKECAHKCNQYFDPISSPDLKKGKHNKICFSLTGSKEG